MMLTLRNLASRSARELVRAARLRRSFEDPDYHATLLRDEVRLRAYAQAIDHIVRPHHTVLEVGTGTGILAMHAARCGARVIAIERGGMIEAARQIAKAHGSPVEFIRGDIRKVALPCRADVVIHELFGLSIFDENVVELLQAVHARHLAPRGVLLPSHLKIYVAPVELYEDVYPSRLEDLAPLGFSLEAASPISNRLNRGRGIERRFRFHTRHIRVMLANRKEVFCWDMRDPPPPMLDLRGTMTVEREGTLHGLGVFFDLEFPGGAAIVNDHDRPPTHWGFQFLRVRRRSVSAGQRLSPNVSMSTQKFSPLWKWSID